MYLMVSEAAQCMKNLHIKYWHRQSYHALCEIEVTYKKRVFSPFIQGHKDGHIRGRYSYICDTPRSHGSLTQPPGTPQHCRELAKKMENKGKRNQVIASNLYT